MPVAAVLDGFFPVLLGARIGGSHASVDQAVAMARILSTEEANSVAVVRLDGSFGVHELWAPSPDGTLVGIDFEMGVPRAPMPDIEQPLAGLIAIVDGERLVMNKVS
jgi:hypothetical protein